MKWDAGLEMNSLDPHEDIAWTCGRDLAVSDFVQNFHFDSYFIIRQGIKNSIRIAISLRQEVPFTAFISQDHQMPFIIFLTFLTVGGREGVKTIDSTLVYAVRPFLRRFSCVLCTNLPPVSPNSHFLLWTKPSCPSPGLRKNRQCLGGLRRCVLVYSSTRCKHIYGGKHTWMWYEVFIFRFRRR